jgi:flagellar protein FlgJ
MDVLGLAQSPAMTAATSRDGDPRRVEVVAKGFESVFLSMLVKEMRQTLDPDTLFGSDQGDVLGGLFDQFMGEHLAPAGSLGIAALVRQQLTPKHTHEQHPPQPAHARRNAGPTLS